jgi:hypothetical protein
MIIRARNHPERLGTHVTILSDFVTHNPATGGRWSEAGHLVDIPNTLVPGSLCCYPPSFLAPIPDDKFERFHADLISCDDDWTIPWSVTV